MDKLRYVIGSEGHCRPLGSGGAHGVRVTTAYPANFRELMQTIDRWTRRAEPLPVPCR